MNFRLRSVGNESTRRREDGRDVITSARAPMLERAPILNGEAGAALRPRSILAIRPGLLNLGARISSASPGGRRR